MPQELLTRQIDLNRDSIIDPESRQLRLSFSSEEPVTRKTLFSEPWIEGPGHTDGEMNFERLNNSAPLLYNHDRSERDSRIGMVEHAWIEKDRGQAQVRLSKRAGVEGIRQDVPLPIAPPVSPKCRRTTPAKRCSVATRKPGKCSSASFTRSGNLSGFKQHTRVGMGVFDTLDEVRKGGEYKHGSLGERAESIQLATCGKLFSITRQAIINNDLTAFTDIPCKTGRAATRTVGDPVFNVITGNPAMSDGTALFHADHNNLAGSGGASSAATAGAGRTAMRTRKDGVATFNTSPSFFLMPAALEDTARVLMVSETDPGKTNSRIPNPVRGAARIIVDAQLDADSVTTRYLLANPGIFDTIKAGYLDGVAAEAAASGDANTRLLLNVGL